MRPTRHKAVDLMSPVCEVLISMLLITMAVRGESLEGFSKSGLIPDMLKAALR